MSLLPDGVGGKVKEERGKKRLYPSFLFPPSSF
jgi:hypothetical protein